MEVVQQKVMFPKILAPRVLETAPFSEHTKDPAVPSFLPRPHPPPFPTSRSSGMTSNISPFTISQATASNHKVVVDCHSQIAVRALLCS
jgi:hypothetical protein